MSNKIIIGIGFLVLAFVSADYIVVLAEIALALGLVFTGWGIYIVIEDRLFR